MLSPNHPDPKMSELLQQPPVAGMDERVVQIEARLARLELQLGLEAMGQVAAPRRAADDRTPGPAMPMDGTAQPVRPPQEDTLELELGQNWFARAGILALAAGGAFMLTLPYPQLPPALPTIVGVAVATAVFATTRLLPRPFEVLSSCLRVASMALLYFAVLRLFYFGAVPALTTDSYFGRGLLLAAVALNVAIGWQRRSVWLTGLGLVTGYTTALAIGSGGFVLGVLFALALAGVLAAAKLKAPGLVFATIVLTFGTYLAWAFTHGAATGAPRMAASPAIAPAVALACLLVLAVAPFVHRGEAALETPLQNVTALANCVLGYAAFFLHTIVAFGPQFAPANMAASGLLLGLAVLFWTRRHSYVATFLYAMAGYVALSLAILKLSAPPNVFVWLSLQSLLVIATAIALRSRFIVVANFAIYVGIVLAYLVLKQQESGISIGFGVVALVSARLLNWQQHRLELKTELMRNAYLVSGFVMFPYGLNHLVSSRHVALAWVALAVGYYALGLLVRSPKYRWMGHGTLLLTAIYMLTIGTRNFEPVYRVVSFLVLGTVLLVVSLAFTRVRNK